MNRLNETPEMLSLLAEMLPFKLLVKQVKMAIDDYLTDTNDKSAGFIIFTMQIAMMKHIMDNKHMTSEQLAEEMSRQSGIMDLFKENNN
jgi:hypothetical protein